MSYRTGQMGIAEGTALVFILYFARLFLTAPGARLDDCASLGWLAAIITGLVILVMLLLLLQAMSGFSGDLINVSRQLLGKPASWLICAYYCFTFFSNVVLLLRRYAENTMLTALPGIEFTLITLLYALIAAIGVYLGIETIVRASYFILPVIIASIFLVMLLLYPYYRIFNLEPWQGKGIGAVINAGFSSAGLGYGSFAILLLLPAFQNRRTVKTAAIFGMSSSFMIVSISILVFTMVFGVAVGREKILPFFEMSRLVYLSRYFQRIEALFIVIWVITGLLGISANLYMSGYLFTRLFKLPAMRPIIPLMTMAAVELSLLPSDVAAVIRLDKYMLNNYFIWGVYLIPSILILTAWLKKKKKVTACR